MKRIFVDIIMFLSAALPLCAQRITTASPDTVWVSDRYTTHFAFPTDIIYADLSNQNDIFAQVPQEAKDILAVQAIGPFRSTCNITTMESNGTMRSYILAYRAHPSSLIVDERHGVYHARPDTLRLSDLYTSHMVFSSEILYAFSSDVEASAFASTIVKESGNVLALRAKEDFSGETFSITVLESDKTLHTFIVRYDRYPSEKVIDLQRGRTAADGSPIRRGGDAGGNPDEGSARVVSLLRSSDAPQLADVVDLPRRLNHLAVSRGRVTVQCENVFSYSDVTYIVLSIVNRSGVSYEADRTAFVVGTAGRNRKKIVEETNVLPKASAGSLTVRPGATGRIAYSFDKLTITKGQRLDICVYERGGRRDFVLVLSPDDVNLADAPFEKR